MLLLLLLYCCCCCCCSCWWRCNISNNILTFSIADNVAATNSNPCRRWRQRYLFICIWARSSITFNAFDVLQHGQNWLGHSILAHTHTHTHTRWVLGIADCGLLGQPRKTGNRSALSPFDPHRHGPMSVWYQNEMLGQAMRNEIVGISTLFLGVFGCA